MNKSDLRVQPAQDLRSLAWFIWRHRSSEGDMRRCISTAYYAVFRLIADDGLETLAPKDVGFYLNNYRKFTHTTMKEACRRLRERYITGDNILLNFKPLLIPDGQQETMFHPIPIVQSLSELFYNLHTFREIADYDMYEPISQQTPVDVFTILNNMEDFFEQWEQLKTDNPIALKSWIVLLFLGTHNARFTQVIHKHLPQL